MPNMTLAIPADLKKKMDHFKEINWSEVARQAILQKTTLLEKMNNLFSKSKLTEQEIDRYAIALKKKILGKHRTA